MTAHTNSGAVTEPHALHHRMRELESRLAALERRVEDVAGARHEQDDRHELPSLPPDADAAVAWLVNYRAADRW